MRKKTRYLESRPNVIQQANSPNAVLHPTTSGLRLQTLEVQSIYTVNETLDFKRIKVSACGNKANMRTDRLTTSDGQSFPPRAHCAPDFATRIV